MRTVAQKTNYYQHTSINFKNYIYLKYYNYLKYSTSNPSAFFNNFSKDLKLKMFFSKSISPKSKEQLEKNLNYFLCGKQGLLSRGISEEMSQELIDAVTKTFKESFNDYDINWNKLDVVKAKATADYNKSLQNVQNEHSHYIATWDNQLQKLAEAVQAMNGVNMERYNVLQSQLDDLNKKWENIIKSLGNKVKINKDGLRSGVLINNKIQGFSDFERDYNSLYDILLGKGGKDSLAKGYLLEVITAVSTLMLTNKIEYGIKDIDQLIKKALVGGKENATRKGIDMWAQRYASASELSKIMHGQKLQYCNGGLFTSTKTQGKSDVQFEIDTKKVNVSVKNYNLKTNDSLSLVSKSPLRNLIQKDDAFLSHYLNVLTQHGYYDHEKRRDEPTFVLRALAHNTMRKLIFARSLAGGGTFELLDSGRTQYSPQADLFVLNDVHQGRIKVYYIKDILSQVFQDLSLMSIASEITKKRSDGTKTTIQGYPKNNNFTFKIDGWKKWKWYPPNGDYGKRRMLQLYEQLYNIKISTEISMELFKKDFGYKT